MATPNTNSNDRTPNQIALGRLRVTLITVATGALLLDPVATAAVLVASVAICGICAAFTPVVVARRKARLAAERERRALKQAEDQAFEDDLAAIYRMIDAMPERTTSGPCRTVEPTEEDHGEAFWGWENRWVPTSPPAQSDSHVSAWTDMYQRVACHSMALELPGLVSCAVNGRLSLNSALVTLDRCAADHFARALSMGAKPVGVQYAKPDGTLVSREDLEHAAEMVLCDRAEAADGNHRRDQELERSDLANTPGFRVFIPVLVAAVLAMATPSTAHAGPFGWLPSHGFGGVELVGLVAVCGTLVLFAGCVLGDLLPAGLGGWWQGALSRRVAVLSGVRYRAGKRTTSLQLEVIWRDVARGEVDRCDLPMAEWTLGQRVAATRDLRGATARLNAALRSSRS